MALNLFLVIFLNTSLRYSLQNNGTYFSKAILQALFPYFVNFWSLYNIANIFKWKVTWHSTQRFPVAPHLQQNKSGVPTVTQGIWLPGLLSSCPHSWTLATCAPLLLVFSNSSAQGLGKCWPCYWAYSMLTLSGRALAVLVEICTTTSTPAIITLPLTSTLPYSFHSRIAFIVIPKIM